MKIDALPAPSKPVQEDEILKHRLAHYRDCHVDPKIREACKIILDHIDRTDVRRLVPKVSIEQIKILQAAIKLKMDCPERDVMEILAEVTQLIEKNEIF